MPLIKVALICDSIEKNGEEEKILKMLSEMFPSAPIYTLFYNRNVVKQYFPDSDIRSTFLQKIPESIRGKFYINKLIPIFAIERLDLSEFNIIISIPSIFAKGIITTADSSHIAYNTSTFSNIWSNKNYSKKKFIPSAYPIARWMLRLWDLQSASRIDRLISSSVTVKKQIKKYYNKDSVVVYPPCKQRKRYAYAIELFKRQQQDNAIPSKFFLMNEPLISESNIENVISAFNKLKYNLVILGEGKHKKKFQKQSGKNILFIPSIPDELITEYYNRCIAFINASTQGSLINVAEQMMQGRPVICIEGSEITHDIKDNIIISQSSPIAIADNIRKIMIDIKKGSYQREQFQKEVEKFKEEYFVKKIKDIIKEELAKLLIKDST